MSRESTFTDALMQARHKPEMHTKMAEKPSVSKRPKAPKGKMMPIKKKGMR